MLAPEFCYQLPATTRQFTGPAPPEDNGDELPRGGPARGSAKASQRAQAASLPSHQAAFRGSRSLVGPAVPTRPRSAGARSQRLRAGIAVADGRDADSNDWEEDELPHVDERRAQDYEQGDEHEEEEEEEQPRLPPQKTARGRVAGGSDARVDARSATAQAYGVGSRNGRAQALLGVTAAVAAAETAAGDEDFDLDDEEMRTAFRAAQEVLNNPAATRILLRLIGQHDGQPQQHERFQHEGLHPHAAAVQDQARFCRQRHRQGSEPEADEDEDGEEEDGGGELDADGQEAVGQAVGASGGKGQWHGEQGVGAPGVRIGPLNEGRAQRQAAMQYSQPFASGHPSSRAAPRMPAGGGGLGRGDRAFFPGPGGAMNGMVPHSSATGVAGRVGSAAAAAGRQMGMAGRLDGFGGDGGNGVRRPVGRPQAAEEVEEAWEDDDDDDDAGQNGWPDETPNEDDEDWEGDEGLEAARRYGAAAARPARAAGAQRSRAQGGQKAVSAAAAMSGPAALGRRAGSPHRGRATRHPQPLQYMPPAHFNAATTAAAAAAAAVAAATAAGEAPLRLAGHGHHGQVLGKRSWLESNGGGSSFGGDPSGRGPEELQPFQHQPQHLPHLHYHQAAMPPSMLRRLEEQLQAYQSRSAAAAAAAAAAAVASAANVSQPRGYHGHILC